MSQAHAHSQNRVPRPALVAMGGLALVALVGASWVRLSGVPVRAPDAPVAMERALRFEDRSDGSIAVIDAHENRVVDSINGQAGFVRGTLRGLARERKRQGIGADQPFRLLGRTDGRLTLQDPATGRLVDLESFGPVNAIAFARLLTSTTQH